MRAVGFDSERGSVWSDNIGLNYFHNVVVAAYVLVELYTQSVALTMVDKE
ncbi:MAG: hypothetical protein IJ324_05265 [Lachnospiraceae bacterium]|nr:hypothetical protein [Lachnospiraceae bacterium]